MNRLLTAAVAAAALWAAACGGGNGSSVQPPPLTGNFKLASLNGTYAFITSGEVFGGATVNPMSRVGSFIADGKGGISGGTEDVNTADSPSGAQSITGGSYKVDPDGRGTLTLNFQSGNFTNFAFVLTSGSNGPPSIASEGFMIDETSTATGSAQDSTGSGNFVLQDPAVCSAPVTSVAGTYVFDFSGLDSGGLAESFVGEFTANNGPTTADFGDMNDGGTLNSASFSATFAPDSLNPAGLTACGRGQAKFTTTQTGLQTYAFYVVDSKRVRFINSAGGEMLSGDAVFQSTAPSSPSGGFVFIVAGVSAKGGVTRVGRFTATGASVSNVLVDTNNAGNFIQTNSGTATSLTMDAANPGRGKVTFKDPNLSVPFTFVFYLSSASSGVIQDQSQSATSLTDIADGSILAQTGSPFTSSNISGTYALNWSGLSVQTSFQDEEDLLAQASIKNLTLSGTADIFQFTNGIPRHDFGLGGTITLGGDGTGGGNPGMRNTMGIALNGASGIGFVVYFASPDLALFANSNNNGTQRIVAGVLKAQAP